MTSSDRIIYQRLFSIAKDDGWEGEWGCAQTPNAEDAFNPDEAAREEAATQAAADATAGDDGSGEDSEAQDGILDVFKAFNTMTDEERAQQQLRAHFLDGLSSTNTTLAEACGGLEIVDPESAYLPGMAVEATLFKHQVFGIEWIIGKLSVRGGCVLADEMGLGKTIQCLGALARLNTLRYEAGDHAQDMWMGAAKATLIVVTKMVALQWKKAVEDFLPSGYDVILYTADFKATLTPSHLKPDSDRRVVITIYDILGRRHPRSARESWYREKKRTNPSLQPSDWPYDLRGCFGLVILDEAHMIKRGTQSHRWRTTKSFESPLVIAATGTPIPNKDVDFAGIAGIITPADPWEDTESTADPFLRDTPLSRRLQCTERGIRDFIGPLTDDEEERGRRLQSVFKQCLLRRTYATVIDGKPIGASIPEMKVYSVPLKASSAEQVELDQYHREHEEDLFVILNDDNNLRIYMNAAKVRKLAHIATWAPFHYMDWSATELKRFQPVNANLRSVLTSLRARYPQMLDYDPEQGTEDELLQRVAAKSPKIRYLCLLIAIIVLVLRTKVVLWVHYPWPQYLLFLGCNSYPFPLLTSSCMLTLCYSSSRWPRLT